MYRFSLVLSFLFLFAYGGVFGGPIFSKPKPKTPVVRPLPPITGSHRTPTDVHGWCVTRLEREGGVPDQVLRDWVQDVCSNRRKYGIDCKAIRPKGPCFFNNEIREQASYVLNLNLIKTHNCVTPHGILTHVDPSRGKCRFQVPHLNKY